MLFEMLVEGFQGPGDEADEAVDGEQDKRHLLHQTKHAVPVLETRVFEALV